MKAKGRSALFTGLTGAAVWAILATLALILGIVGQRDIAPLGWRSAASIHLLAEAERRAFARRNALLGDPAFGENPTAPRFDPIANALDKTGRRFQHLIGHRVIAIDDGAFQPRPREQSCLCLRVLGEIAVKIQVVAAQIGKDRCLDPGAIETSDRNPDRRRFQRHSAQSVMRPIDQERLQIHRFRGRQPQGPEILKRAKTTSTQGSDDRARRTVTLQKLRQPL
jgi:hypothetical protein